MRPHQSKLTNGFLPNSIKFLSSCVKTVSSGVRSAGTSVATAISSDDRKDQVLWACFDRLELGPSTFKNVLLLGYINGFQVLDVDDASNVSELVSKRDDPCTFMQIQPIPAKVEDSEGFRASHPLLLVVAGNDTKGDPMLRRREGLDRDGFVEPLMGNFICSPTNVRFYSMRSHNYVHVLRFRSAVYMVRCSPRIIAVGLASQIYCFDAVTLESKLSVLTYPVPQSGQGINGRNVGYGPMDVGPRWLAYTPNSPHLTSTGRLSPQNLTPSPGVSPSTSPVSGSLMARYAMESSKQLANGLINLGDIGYKTLSKYCQEFRPDCPGSPLSSNTSWKIGRGSVCSSETDNAGMVVVKDFVSNAVVSQFKAHSSPISALCFDPSGTLLVTASIHGNNINVFRIMPSCSQSGPSSQSSNWTSSHVHLYKLHRGITSAVVQDISFSRFSQWVAIVTSKGTCHIFALSPFGGECGVQVQNYHADGPILAPLPSLPWWLASSFAQNSFSVSPPAPVTLSVVSRIRTGNSGWLNTVSNAASSAAGIASITPDAVSAVFHCSILSSGLGHNGSKVNALEHLLVYSPSGHLIQYELLPSIGEELNESASRAGSGSGIYIQDDELRVKSEIIQWWDVCRRVNWPEREEHITGQRFSGLGMDISDSEDNDISGGYGKSALKFQERSHLHVSNAEVQKTNGRVPMWQRSKIYFYTMSLTGPDGLKFSKDSSGGESEMEVFPDDEVEIRRKDLLPLFNQLQNVSSHWTDRVEGTLRCSNNVSENKLAEDRYSEDPRVLPNKAAIHKSEYELSPSTFSSEVCMLKSVRRSSCISVSSTTQGKLKHHGNAGSGDNGVCQNNNIVNNPCSVADMISGAECCVIGKEVKSSNSVGTSDAGSNRSNFSMNVDEGSAQECLADKIDFGQYFQEGYCKASAPPDECRDMTDGDSNSSPKSKEKSEEDDEMLGGVFAFAQEG